jgi:hypothetical protein
VGESFQLTSGRHVYFGISLQVSDATQSDIFAGLSVTNTNALGGVSDSVRFEKLDGATAWRCVTEKNTTETATVTTVALANDTTATLEFWWDGTRIRFFINGTAVATHTTNVPDDEPLTPTIQWLAGSNGAKRMKILFARALCCG